MSVALCTSCGLRKGGALNRCARCGYQPLDAADQARALLLSDRNLDEAGLVEAERILSEKRPYPYDERALADLEHRLDLDPPSLIRLPGWLYAFLLAAALAVAWWLSGGA